MKILYIHQYFRQPSEGGALRSYYLSQALKNAGHTVELITAYNEKTVKTENIEGVTVHYLPVAYDNRFGFLARLLAFLKFCWLSSRLAFKIKGIDVCFATSTPLTAGLPALLLKKFRCIPYFFEVRDLWPEAPIQLGYIKKPLLKTVLYWLEKVLYRNASKIIALSPGMVQGIRKYQLPVPVYLIPNLADCQFYQPVYAAKNYAQTPFLISYTGTIGKANRVDYLVDIAQVCAAKNLLHLQFIIAGTGAEAEQLKLRVLRSGLKNVTFTGHLTRIETRELLNRSDATYTSFGQEPVLETNSPNKFFDSLAAGKLNVVNTKGWLKELVEQNECGFYADPTQPVTFSEKILPFLEDAALLRKYQENARKVAEEKFSREKLTQEFVKLFK